MSRSIVLILVALSFACCLGVLGQTPGSPPGASDKNLDDRNIKDRSIEMERIKRDADKETMQPGKKVELNFVQIKEDFEQIQVVFDNGIVATYKTSNPMNYKMISDSASEL